MSDATARHIAPAAEANCKWPSEGEQSLSRHRQPPRPTSTLVTAT